MPDDTRIVVRSPGAGGLIAQDTTAVNQNTTAVNENATAVNQNATAVNQNATAVNVAADLQVDVDRIPSAPGTPYCAQFPGNVAILFDGPYTRFRPARNVRFVVGPAGVPTIFRIVGTSVYGDVLDVSVNSTGAGTFESNHAFDTIQQMSTNVPPGDTVDMVTGKGFSIGPVTGLDSINSSVGVDGSLQSVDYANETSASIVPATAPDGTKVYTVRYTVAHSHTQAPHTHVQDVHTHAQAPHTHVQVAHSHPQNAHRHNVT